MPLGEGTLKALRDHALSSNGVIKSGIFSLGVPQAGLNDFRSWEHLFFSRGYGFAFFGALQQRFRGG
jgi:hypothetical protein